MNWGLEPTRFALRSAYATEARETALRWIETNQIKQHVRYQ